MANIKNWARVDLFSSYSQDNTIQESDRPEDTAIMEVPLTGDCFEIPVFMLSDFTTILTQNRKVDAMVANLCGRGRTSSFRTFDKMMTTSLVCSYHSEGLVSLQGTQGKKKNTYFATHGALFDEYLDPMMICTWTALRMSDGSGKWTFTKPTMRISSQFFVRKPDNVWRFICKKLASELCTTEVNVPIRSYCNDKITYPDSIHSWGGIKPEVVIGDIPFRMREVLKPDIRVSSKELIKTVLDYIDTDFT